MPVLTAQPTGTQAAGLFGWYRQGTPAARRALLAASLGWMLDAFDVMLYALVLGVLIRDFSLSKTTAGLLGSLTLIASGFGGILFGAVADRYGRRPALSASLLVYSVFTFTCGLSTTVWQLGVSRFLLGLGMGGEWTSGAALVSETWPAEHRAKAMGFMQSAWSIGYAAAALVVAAILPRLGWRAVFFIGILPALLVVWIRRGVEESAEWKRQRRVQHDWLGGIGALFARVHLRHTLLLTALSTTTIFAYWGLNLWIPAYLSLPPSQGGVGLDTLTTTALVVLIQAGTFFGYMSFGFVADAIGRRRSFLLYILTAAVLVLGFSRTRQAWSLALLGPVAAFFGTGFFSGFGTVVAELYPTAIRATAQGFTYNVGRMGSALAPFLIGSLAETRGFGVAFGVLSVALLLGAATWIGLPETRGRRLSS